MRNSGLFAKAIAKKPFESSGSPKGISREEVLPRVDNALELVGIDLRTVKSEPTTKQYPQINLNCLPKDLLLSPFVVLCALHVNESADLLDSVLNHAVKFGCCSTLLLLV